MSKSDIIKKGIEMGVDYSLTHSCYDPIIVKNNFGLIAKIKSCQKCDSCLLRNQGFNEANIIDQTLGIVGNDKNQGSTGLQGATGASGLPGLNGASGLPGSTGLSGATGPTLLPSKSNNNGSIVVYDSENKKVYYNPDLFYN